MRYTDLRCIVGWILTNAYIYVTYTPSKCKVFPSFHKVPSLTFSWSLLPSMCTNQVIPAKHRQRFLPCVLALPCPWGDLGPLWKGFFLVKNKAENPAVAGTNSSSPDHATCFHWHFISGWFLLQVAKLGIQMDLNNEENSLAHVPENSRCKSCFQVKPNLVTQQHHQGAGFFLFFYSAIYWVNFIRYLGPRWQPVVPRTICFLSHYLARKRDYIFFPRIPSKSHEIDPD